MYTHKLRLYASCLLLSTNFIHLYAQENFEPGRLVLNSRDTVSGWIDYQKWRSSPKTIHFRETPSSPIQHLSPLETHAFFVGGEWYAGKIVQLDKSPNRVGALDADAQPRLEADTMFVQALVLGKAHLWMAVDQTGREHFFLEKDSLPITPLIFKKYYGKDGMGIEGVKTNQRFKGQLAFYLGTCKQAVRLAANSKYKITPLTKVVRAYNDCFPDGTQFIKQKDRIRLEVSASAGISFFSMNMRSNDIESLQQAKFTNSTQATGGMGLNIVFPRDLGRWAIYNSLLFESYKTSAQIRTYPLGISGYVDRSLRFENAYMRLSTMLRYQNRTTRTEPFFCVGLSHALPISSNNDDRLETYFGGDVVSTKGYFENNFGGFERALTAGGGIEFRRFQIETRIEYVNGRFFTSSSHGIQTTRLYLLLGYRL